mgnify:CR=1 FL=1
MELYVAQMSRYSFHGDRVWRVPGFASARATGPFLVVGEKVTRFCTISRPAGHAGAGLGQALLWGSLSLDCLDLSHLQKHNKGIIEKCAR